jgi:hypothetical protein
MSSREPMASSDTREDSSLASDAVSKAGVSSADVRVEQELVRGDSQFRVPDASPECFAEHYGRCATCGQPRTKHDERSTRGSSGKAHPEC